MRCKLLRLVIQGVCQSVTRHSCANMAERIEVLLGVETFRDPRKVVLDGNPDSPTDWMRPSPNYFGHLRIMRLHRMRTMHQMQPIVTDNRDVCPSVCLSLLHCAKTDQE